MRPELQAEIDRLKTILAESYQDFLPVEPASPEVFQRIEAETGVALDPDLRDFFSFSNGSAGEVWGAIRTDRVIPVTFPNLEEAYHQWALFSPYDDSVYEEWNLAEGDDRDPRIQPAYIRHRLWFPVGECDGYCTSLLFDADPTAEGAPGQLIAYECDPDRIYYVAGSFLEFFKRSNDLLESRADELFYPQDEEAADETSPEEIESLKRVLAQTISRDAEEHQGLPLKERAAEFGYSDMLSFLFGHQEGLRISLDVAVMNNHLDLVQHLLSHGAAVDSRDEFGETPLMTAAGCGHAEMLKLLLDQGADAQARAEDGETALDKARRKGHGEIVRLLEKAGVR
jgi:cell wall assembly regulator SMI1